MIPARYSAHQAVRHVETTREVVWYYQGSNSPCSVYLDILKDESKPRHRIKQLRREESEIEPQMHFIDKQNLVCEAQTIYRHLGS